MIESIALIQTAARRTVRGLQQGFNLIELMVGIAIVSLVLYFMIPSMAAWMQGSQIRNAADSMLTGMQLARTEAVRRNTNVQFVFTSLVGGGTLTDWSVSCVTASAECPGAGQAETFIQAKDAKEGSPNAKVTITPGGTTSLVYTGTGRITPVPAGNITINVVHQKDNSCIADGGDFRCLRIIVTPGGQARMCDPALPAAPANVRGC